jgi:hypothetical protein
MFPIERSISWSLASAMSLEMVPFPERPEADMKPADTRRFATESGGGVEKLVGDEFLRRSTNRRSRIALARPEESSEKSSSGHTPARGGKKVPYYKND